MHRVFPSPRVAGLDSRTPNVTPHMLILTGLAIEAVALASAAQAQSGGILEQSVLRMVCLGGSVIGAWLSVWLSKRSETESLRMLAGKLFSSAVGGMLFTPMFFDCTGWTLTFDRVWFVSGSVAFLSISALQFAMKEWEKRFPKYLSDKADSITGPVDPPAKP